MKIHISSLRAISFAGFIAAQWGVMNAVSAQNLLPIPDSTAAPAVSATAPAVAVGTMAAAAPDTTTANPDGSLTPAQLNDLLGPIALYPDALIAVILPASTEPADIVLAARFIAEQGDPALIDLQPWDDSVKALAHYPEVVKWMDDNLNWTKAMGDAFVRQPADVMKAVQQLRAQAKAAGTLVDTPQQKVVTEDSNIVIQPAQPNVIYVPQYDPAVVYVQQAYPYPYPFIAFSAGYPVGPWLGFQCNWFNFGIWVGPWTPGIWYYPRSYWSRTVVVVAGRPWHAWSPSHRVVVEANRNFARQGPAGVPRPRVIAGAPAFAHAEAPGARPGEARPGEARPEIGAARPGEAPRGVAPVVAARGEPNGARPATAAPRAPLPNENREGVPVPRTTAPVVSDRAEGPNVTHAVANAPRAPAPDEGREGVPAPRTAAPAIGDRTSASTFEPRTAAPASSRTFTPMAASSAPGPYRVPTYTPKASPSFSPTYSRGPAMGAPASAGVESRGTTFAPAPMARGPVGGGGGGAVESRGGGGAGPASGGGGYRGGQP
jgi:hypothetical protein